MNSLTLVFNSDTTPTFLMFVGYLLLQTIALLKFQGRSRIASLLPVLPQAIASFLAFPLFFQVLSPNHPTIYPMAGLVLIPFWLLTPLSLAYMLGVFFHRYVGFDNLKPGSAFRRLDQQRYLNDNQRVSE